MMGQKIAPRYLFSAIVGGLVCAIVMGAATPSRAASTVIGGNQFFLEGNIDLMLAGEGPAPGTFPGPYQNLPDDDLNFILNVTADSSTATFTFTNASIGAYAGTSITEIYFQNGLFNDIFGDGSNQGLSTSGVSYPDNDGPSGDLYLTPPATPSNPGSNFPANWPNGTTGFAVDSDNADAGNKNNAGIQGGDVATRESWSIVFDNPDGLTTDDIVNLINIGGPDSLNNIAFHIRQVPGDPGSLWVVTWPETAIPVPAALPLFLSGLAGLGVMARRRRKKAA